MGRPTTLTEQHVREAEEATRLGLTQDLVAAYIGVGTTTFYRWMSRGQREPDSIYGRFRGAVKRGQAKGAALSLARIRRAGQGGQWQADAWLLERCHGYRRDAPQQATEAEPTSRADRLASLRRSIQQVGISQRRDDEE